MRRRVFMTSKGMLRAALGCLGAIAVLGQNPPPPPAAPAAPQHGPGVQAQQDERYGEAVATCRTPPKVPGPRGGRGAQPKPTPRDYKVTEIPGIIASGQTWKSIWTGEGNNADGIIATKDGGILAAQNTNSAVLKLD